MPGTIVIGSSRAIPFQINQVDTLAGTSFEGIAPFDGFISGIRVAVQVAPTTGGTVKVINGAATDVAGAVVTVPNAAAKGLNYAASATDKDPSRVILKGARFQVKPTSFATAGAVNGVVEFQSAN